MADFAGDPLSYFFPLPIGQNYVILLSLSFMATICILFFQKGKHKDLIAIFDPSLFGFLNLINYPFNSRLLIINY